MAKIHDIRSQTKRSNGTRPLSRITHIARHHSATTSGDFFSFWRHWNGTNGWNTGGYHEIILRDGSVQLCYDPEEITNGVANHNSYVYHICVVGNGSFTEAQERTWQERALYNMKRLNVPVERVLGHREFKGASTSCPGIDMNVVRSRLKTGELPTTSADPIDKGYLVYGDHGASVKKLAEDLQFLGYAVTPIEYFNAEIKSTLMSFQKAQNLAQDGSYGPATQSTLAKVIKDLKDAQTASGGKKEEDEKLELSARQRQEIAATFKKARERGVFSSEAHEKAILDGTMTQSQLLYLNNLVAGAALVGGKRINADK